MLGHRTLTIDDYFGILKRRWRILLPPIVLAPLIALGASYLVTPKYLSQTLVLVEQPTVPDDYVKSVVSEDLSSRLASMQEQILSRSRLEPIILRYHLYASEKGDMDDRLVQARKNIAVKPIESHLERTNGLPGFFVSFEAGDPHTAQLVCEEITSLFVTQNLHAREESAEDTTDFLSEQLNSAKRSLDEQDAKLAAFQTQYFGKLPSDQTANVNMLTSLNLQLDADTQSLARMEQDKTYSEMLLSERGGAPVSSASGPRSSYRAPDAKQIEMQKLLAQLADLKTRYTDDYPDVVAVRRKIADLKKEPDAAVAASGALSSAPSGAGASAGIEQLRAEIQAQEQGIALKKKEQAQIQSQIGLYQDRIRSSPEVQEQYKEMTRDYQTAQKFYDDLLAKMNQSKMAADLESRQQGEQFRVVDRANLPDAPTFPKRALFLGAGFVAGLGLGLLLVGLLEYKDTSLRSERDIFAFTHLPTLAVIGVLTGEPPARGKAKPRKASRKEIAASSKTLVDVR